MDIRDFEGQKIPQFGPNYFDTLCQLQGELLAEYRLIEQLPTSLILDYKPHQLLIKDFFGRAVEEMAEAFEHKDPILYQEECIDALHFMTETLLLLPKGPERFRAWLGLVEGSPEVMDFLYMGKMNFVIASQQQGGNNTDMSWFWLTTYWLKLAGNALRNKAWKQTEVLANSEVFYNHFFTAYRFFIQGLMWRIGWTPQELLWNYYKKNQVNRFRIKSKY